MTEETTDSGLVVVRDDEPENQTRKGPHPTPIKLSKRKAKRRMVRESRRRNR